MYIHPTLEEFFVANADKIIPCNNKGCIVFDKPKDFRNRPRHYYYVGNKRISVDVQKYVHFLFTRHTPNSKEQVVNICGVELCCNPFHLGVGTRTRALSLDEAARAHERRLAPLAPINPHRHMNRR